MIRVDEAMKHYNSRKYHALPPVPRVKSNHRMIELEGKIHHCSFETVEHIFLDGCLTVVIFFEIYLCS